MNPDYLIFLLIILFFIFSLRQAPSETLTPVLDYSVSNQLKALAILMVILSHLINYKVIHLPEVYKFAGTWGVAIFLLLSGYGLTQSYLKKGIEKGYLVKRFQKVLIPYMIVTVIWYLIDFLAFHKTFSWITIVTTLIGLDLHNIMDPTMWFVTYIIFWYFIFYIIFKIPLPNIVKVAALLGVTVILKRYILIKPVFSNVGWYWDVYGYMFPLGVLAGMYYQKVSTFLKTKIMLSLVALVGILSFIGFSLYASKIMQSNSKFFFDILTFSLGLICLFIIIRYFKFESKLLLFIGSFSYELYLIEYVFIGKISLLGYFNNRLLSLIFYFIVIITFSLILHKLSLKISDNGFRRLKV